MVKYAKFLLRIIISTAILIYVGLKMDWSSLYAILRQINIFYYLLSTGLALASTIFIAGKYRLLIKNTSLSLSIRRLVVINIISRFYALCLPSALGTEAVRWYKVTQNKKGRSFFLATTVVERLFFLFILLLFGTLPLYLHIENPKIIALREQIAPLLFIAFALVISGLLFFLFPKFQQSGKNFIHKILSIKQESRISRFLQNFEIRQPLVSIAPLILLLSIAWQLIFILRMFYLFLSLHLTFSIIDVTWMGSLVLLLQVLPISFAGIGVREGAFAYFFMLFSVPDEKGFLVGMLFFSQMLIFAVTGAILNLLE